MSSEGRRSPPGARLLVVDDEATQRRMLSSILSRAGYNLATAGNGEEAIEELSAARFDLLLTDQRMPGIDGLALLERARSLQPDLPVILMTAYGSVSSAVEAMKRGASDYLTKPFGADELLLVLEKVLRQQSLEDELASLRTMLKDRHRLGGLLGQAAVMQELFSRMERIADTDVPVLIRGESGTGKELAARAIHALGPRANGPFIALNCAAIPENLLESEFFGHEKGAFTGAEQACAGRFEQAHLGTLLLDEIGAMRVELQAKLLRVLQEGEVQRLGGRKTIPVDVRILAATGENLEQEIERGRFREDLYYRLNVVPLPLPPLRDRPEDIPLLLEHFLSRASERLDRPVPLLEPSALDQLQGYPWPGNVRELQNVAERLVILGTGERVGVVDLPDAIQRGGLGSGPSSGGVTLPPEGLRLTEVEHSLITQALRRSRGNLGPAAKLLGISYKTLQYRIRKYGIDRAALD